MRLFAFVAALVILPAAVGAQNTYRRAPGDTLVYEETTKVVNTATTPMGEMSTEMTSEGSTAFAFRAADTVTVTLNPTKITVKTPMGEMSPGVGSVAGKSFEMTMGPRGDVRVITDIELPREFQAMASVSSMFNDYFVTLPEQSLRTGLEWTDTLTHTDTTTSLKTRIHRVARYRVEKDTVVDGRKAWLISSTADSDTESAGTVNQGGMDMQVNVMMKAQDTSRIVFAQEGLLLSREIRSTQSGTSRVDTPTAPMELAMSGTVEITRRLVR